MYSPFAVCVFVTFLDFCGGLQNPSFLETGPTLVRPSGGGLDRKVNVDDSFRTDVDSDSVLAVSPEDLRDLFRLEASDGRCLNFLHIPKTAGTSIEQDSRVLGHWQNNSGVKGWGIYDNSLHCSHPLGLKPKLPAVIRDRVGDGHTCRVPSLADGHQICDKRHVPPSLDAKIRAQYEECETFCVVRDPIQRLISQAGYMNIPCNSTAIEDFAREFLNDTQLHPGSGPGSGWRGHIGCHGLHQSEYIYGGIYKYSKKGDYCQHVLKFENLDEEFTKLMEDFDLPVRLESHSKDNHCDVTLAKDVQKLIKAYYSEDYENFGY